MSEEDQTFTKEILGPNTISDEKMKKKLLGLNWDIQNDEFYYDLNEIIDFANSAIYEEISFESNSKDL